MNIFLAINNAASTYMIGVTSFPLPDTNFKITYETIPNTIPSAIEYANGIITIVKNAGIA